MSEIGVNTVVAGCDTDSGMRASADEKEPLQIFTPKRLK